MTTAATASRQLVVFSLGAEEYALPIEDVHEIIRYAPPRRVASRDRSVCGVISLRGKILSVHDLAVRLGLEADAGSGSPGKIVIVQCGDLVAGVVVDDVAEVLTVSAEQLDVEGARGIRGDDVEAIAKIDDRLVVVLRPAVLVGVAEASEEAVPAPSAAAEPTATTGLPTSADVAVAAA